MTSFSLRRLQLLVLRKYKLNQAKRCYRSVRRFMTIRQVSALNYVHVHVSHLYSPEGGTYVAGRNIDGVVRRPAAKRIIVHFRHKFAPF